MHKLQALMLGIVICGGSYLSSPVQAQDSGATASAMEEVVVTARIREERLQDVAVAVYVESGERLRFRGIDNLEAFSESIPNVQIAESVVSDKLQIRGVSGGDNSGFEQPVGQLRDGFFYSRSRLIRVPLLDVERVEVLKGPQGALIGKNTSAGAISITNAQPTDVFESWGQLSYESFLGEDEGLSFEGALSGPLTDELRGRLAIRYKEGGGFLKNPALGKALPDSDNKTTRVTLDWTPADELDVNLRWTRADLFREGQNRILAFCGPAMRQILDANAAADFACGPPDNVASVVSPINGEGNFDFIDTEADLVGLTVNWDIGGGHRIQSLTGFAGYDTDDWTGGDRTEFEVLNQNLKEDYEQWSQELRLISPQIGQFEYLAGLFYQERDLDTVFSQHINIPPSIFQGPPPFSNVSLAEQDADTVAAFGEFTWHFSESFSATVEGRWTRESKDASQRAFRGAVYSISPDTAFLTLIPSVSGDRSESDFSPGVILEWSPVEDVLLFGSVRRGFKGGGFNLSRVQPSDAFEFEEEEVTSYEIGLKGDFFERQLQLSTVVFFQNFEDLQVSALDTSGGIPILTTTNAAGVDSAGVEVEATWTPTSRLRLQAAVGYNDAEFDDFTNAACFRGQTEAQGCVNGQQDLSGRQVEETPEWGITLSGQYVWSVSSAFDLTVFMLGTYSDEQFASQSGDPNAGTDARRPEQEAFWKLESRVTLRPTDGPWSLSLIGRNLTDEIPAVGGTRLPGFLPEARQPRAGQGASLIVQGKLQL